LTEGIGVNGIAAPDKPTTLTPASPEGAPHETALRAQEEAEAEIDRLAMAD
jgi:hypothetical protein